MYKKEYYSIDQEEAKEAAEMISSRIEGRLWREEVDLSSYDSILINSSAGKDSQAMLTILYGKCGALGIEDRITVIHADMGRMEWAGTYSLVLAQAESYGLPVVKVRREQGDLLHHVENKKEKKYPSPKCRYCTSDHKRAPIEKYITALTKRLAEGQEKGYRPRILNCLGLRADESPDRAKKPIIEVNKRKTNSRREVDNYLPIHTLTDAEVWEVVWASGLPYHEAYDLGMPRLSCAICIYSPREAIKLGAYYNRGLAEFMADQEERIGHTFKMKFSLREILEELDGGWSPKDLKIKSWIM